jgi:hypothetical protein
MPIIRKCQHCGAQNRIPASYLADSGRCGACKELLPPIREPIAADPSSSTKCCGMPAFPCLSISGRSGVVPVAWPRLKLLARVQRWPVKL